MSKMSDMAMTIEELRNAAAAINDAANWLAQQFGGEDEATEKAEVPAAPAKPMRIKAATMLQKVPMPTLFVSTSSVKHLA